MVNWARMYDWYSDVDRVPELLSSVDRKDDAEAWTELWHRLILERDLLSPAGIAALPRLARLAAGSTEARHLASGQRARIRCRRWVVCGVCRSGAVRIQRAASREGGLARIGTRREVNPTRVTMRQAPQPSSATTSYFARPIREGGGRP
ncbi:hypothetical protein [Streptomyces sp. H27-S2]|uniref:hypothetical protein n=1 Tax=Streptomyces antarcticus TaxID=2996458 RepID=UPI002271EDDC|nr:hypothetical protein [Streptomyces sp. H27-S2]MCY0953215.1 hypothetical protein [Streptomyces sp. H27-S2]